MPEAKINESCIIGLPTCGYAFSSSRMAFVAAPSDEDFALEMQVLQTLLQEKDYETYIALLKLDPAKLAFCTKICSKIIASQFCIVLLNSSTHKDYMDIKIPNPNVHMEYGLMLAFKKHILPFQLEGDSLAFNISPLDTIIYRKGNFKNLANDAIDEAIVKTGTTNRPTRALASIQNVVKYLSVLGLRMTQLNTDEANYLYRLGQPFGYFLLDGKDIVYFGPFDLEDAKEVVFRLKLLLQALHTAKQNFETILKKTMTPEQIARAYMTWNKLRVEVYVSPEIDKKKVISRVAELTKDFDTVPWKVVTTVDIAEVVQKEYEEIGDI